MGSTSTISTIRSTQGRELIAHEVLVARTAVAAATKYSDLVYKITFLQRDVLICAKVILLLFTLFT